MNQLRVLNCGVPSEKEFRGGNYCEQHRPRGFHGRFEHKLALKMSRIQQGRNQEEEEDLKSMKRSNKGEFSCQKGEKFRIMLFFSQKATNKKDLESVKINNKTQFYTWRDLKF